MWIPTRPSLPVRSRWVATHRRWRKSVQSWPRSAVTAGCSTWTASRATSPRRYTAWRNANARRNATTAGPRDRPPGKTSVVPRLQRDARERLHSDHLHVVGTDLRRGDADRLVIAWPGRTEISSV